MAKYFDKFPSIIYDIQGKRLTNYQTVTDIFFRLRIIRAALNNISAYYDYLIKDDDTPEILAEKVYGSSEAHWIILMANDIIDAQFDWPLNNDVFRKYIIGKYGSIESAQTSYHHYEKVIQREDQITGVITESSFVINEEEYSEVDLSVPYDTFETLPETQEFNTINMSNGKTVIETIFRRAVTNYDYEEQVNEDRRAIKIIKPEYYSQIIREFDSLTQTEQRNPYIRRLI